LKKNQNVKKGNKKTTKNIKIPLFGHNF